MIEFEYDENLDHSTDADWPPQEFEFILRHGHDWYEVSVKRTRNTTNYGQLGLADTFVMVPEGMTVDQFEHFVWACLDGRDELSRAKKLSISVKVADGPKPQPEDEDDG